MITLNIDAGETGYASERDQALLPFADAINIAVGGHAGDWKTANELARRARANGVQINLHPGYPDPANFGRQVMDLPWSGLRSALNRQREVLPWVSACKFHGALYTLAQSDDQLAGRLAEWLSDSAFTSLVTMPGGEMAKAASAAGIRVIREGFGDRAYRLTPKGVNLVPRGSDGAVFETADQVTDQVRRLALSGGVLAFTGNDTERVPTPVAVDTVCLHGDGANAVELAQAARTALDTE